MAVRGREVHKCHNPTLYIYRVISPLPFYFFTMMPVQAISWKVKKGL